MSEPPMDVPRQPPPEDPEKDAWLARPSSIKLLIRVSLVALAAVAAMDLVVHRHGHFEIEEGVGFGAWFGFAACVAMVLFAKLLGMLLKRPDTYYDE